MYRISLVVGIAIGIFMLVFDAYISYEFVYKFKKSSQKKTDKLLDIEQFREYLSMLKDAETGQRGYIITGNNEYLEPYEKGIKYINSLNTKEFLETAEKQKAVREDISQLIKLTDIKVSELEKVIKLYDDSGFQAAREEVSTNLGKKTMDQIRDVVDEIVRKKEGILDKVERDSNTHLKFIIDLIVSVNIIYTLVISIGLYVVYLEARHTFK